MSDAHPLRGRTRLKLIRDCALGTKTERELGAEYGVTGPSIHDFKVRNAADIDAVRDDLENEFAGLWIAQKQARVAEYEGDVEHINEDLEAAPDAVKSKLYGAKHRALRSVAEELGQLAPKAINVGVHYSIDGVDLERLR